MEEVNDPIYFYQFMERAEAKGLHYLAEADLGFYLPGQMPAEVESALRVLAPDHIHLEQLLDFLRNRSFRQTLLCRKELPPGVNLRWEQLSLLHVAAAARPVSQRPDLTSDQAEKFRGSSGVSVSISEPLVKAAMVHLKGVWPQTVPFDELLAAARARLASEGNQAPENDPAASRGRPPPDAGRNQGADAPRSPTNDDTQALGRYLLTAYASTGTGLVELHLCPPRFAAAVSERPAASPLARLQAETGNVVTNLRHEPVQLGEFERQLLRHLDGSRDHAALADAMAALVARGDLVVEEQGRPVDSTAKVARAATQGVEQLLLRLAQRALLTA